MDNASLTRTFVKSAITGKTIFQANTELRIETIGTALQLWAKQEGMIASANLGGHILSITVKDSSRHAPLLQSNLLDAHLLPAQVDLINGFYQYELANIPRGYQVKHHDGLLFLQDWWHYRQEQAQVNLLGMLLWHKKTWHPIRSVECDRGMMQVFTWGSQISLAPADHVVWLLKIEDEKNVSAHSLQQAVTPSHATQIQARVKDPASSRLPSAPTKYIGSYLVEAGLLSTAQVDVILCDQTTTSMRFGEIVASRGWLKEQTIEYLMKYLIAPHQTTHQTTVQPVIQSDRTVNGSGNDPTPILPPISPNSVTERRIEAASSHSVHDRETLIISMPLDEIS
jgi:hypothetical protein